MLLSAAFLVFVATRWLPWICRLYARNRLELVLTETMLPIAGVHAVYVDTDDEKLMRVFVVVTEHDEEVYNEVLDAEARVLARVWTPFELRVRAHQGRLTRSAVPPRAVPLFTR